MRVCPGAPPSRTAYNIGVVQKFRGIENMYGRDRRAFPQLLLTGDLARQHGGGWIHTTSGVIMRSNGEGWKGGLPAADTTLTKPLDGIFNRRLGATDASTDGSKLTFESGAARWTTGPQQRRILKTAVKAVSVGTSWEGLLSIVVI